MHACLWLKYVFTCTLRVDAGHHADLYRVKDKLDEAGIQWDLHLFADTVNSDATDIAIIIQKTAEKVRPALVVLAHHDKVATWTRVILNASALTLMQHELNCSHAFSLQQHCFMMSQYVCAAA